MSYLKDVLKELGATESQLHSKLVDIVEKAMMLDSDFCSKVAADAMERMAIRFENVDKTLAEVQEISDKALDKATKNAASLKEAMDENMKKWMTAREEAANALTDPVLINAAKIYKEILSITMEICGDGGIEESIKTAGYIIYKWIDRKMEGH